MPRRNPSSSRKRFFEEHIFQDDHTIEDEHGLEIQRTSIYENTSNDDVNIVTERGKAKSSRRDFFQQLKNEGILGASNALDQHDMTNAATIVDSDILENEHVAALEQWDGEMNNQEEIEENTLRNLPPFGPAHYQRQKQGTIIEYKDFGNNTFQCVHCSAYYWRNEKNARGIYTGCCKRGQVRSYIGIPSVFPW